MRKIWKLSFSTHRYLLPLLCQCLPVMMKYVHGHLILSTDVSHDSELIRFISQYCIKYGRSQSRIGRNSMFCVRGIIVMQTRSALD